MESDLLPNCSESYASSVCADSISINDKTNISSDYDDDFMSTMVQAYAITQTLTTAFYVIICVVGLCGNTLVIYVVLRFAKMKTVTNAYIMNLAIADEMFLLGIPFLIATVKLKYWTFGRVMCKIYMTSASLSQFTSSLFLAIMSFDRYFLLCHPLKSMKYRTMGYAKVVCVCLWIVSVIANLPVIIFAGIEKEKNHTSCTILWPIHWLMWKPNEAFVWYSFLLGFAIPVFLTTVFYATVIRLLRWGRGLRMSGERERSEKKVTKMVLTVVMCYIICWLPYWILQLIISMKAIQTTEYVVYIVAMLNSLAYANSVVNPLLYAFQSNSFRSSFIRACVCTKRSVTRHGLSSSKAHTSARVWNFNAGTAHTAVTDSQTEVPLQQWRSNVCSATNHSRMNIVENAS